MTIVWNTVTWYSKLLAAIFFIFAVPVLTFYIGKEYENTRLTIQSYEQIPYVQEETDSVLPIPAEQSDIKQSSTPATTSGIYGEARIRVSCSDASLCEKKPYQGYLSVRDERGTVVTTTETRNDGKFFLLLPPGTYTLAILTPAQTPKIAPVETTVLKGSIVKVSLLLDNQSQ